MYLPEPLFCTRLLHKASTKMASNRLLATLDASGTPAGAVTTSVSTAHLKSVTDHRTCKSSRICFKPGS
jgi:hypothetical protein